MAQDMAPGSRIRFTFKVPDSERSLPTDPKEVTLQAILVSEEKQAMASAAATGTQVGYEALKHSVVSADGKPVTWDDAGKERFIEGCSPKVRALLLRGYEKIHVPAEKAAEDFLASMVVTL